MSVPPAPSHQHTQRPHRAALVEDRFLAAAAVPLRRAGWTPRVDPYTGYGTTRRVRILARMLLAPRNYRPTAADRRGFRAYLGFPAPGERVRVTVGSLTTEVAADRSGYVDAELDVALQPGVHQVLFEPAGPPPGGGPEPGRTAATPTIGTLHVVADDVTFGVVSDVDDTVMITAVPRPLLALWNTFLKSTKSRRAVPGMPELYQRIAEKHPESPFVYVSTGAWNTSSVLQRFLRRNGYPAGPMLLTDWGPTNTGWFRSGPEHKDTSLDHLFTMFPQVRWLLIGDDGQHDPDIYRRADARHPGRVAAVAIRQLTFAQQVLSHGGPVPLSDPRAPGEDGYREVLRLGAPTVVGPDGEALAAELERVLD
ncbi:App1 family protein [Antribacter gilvus]|uniref:App1 family protein n=1 Tax=Antribacter gilvus TaxID=2304675 RepID=UPI000F76AB28|nr:phosphatase domain-containing protein [Antribacter gilvus]